MAIKKWEVTYSIYFDTNNIIKVEVEANTERKAKMKAEEKVKKITNCTLPDFRDIREIK